MTIPSSSPSKPDPFTDESFQLFRAELIPDGWSVGLTDTTLVVRGDGVQMNVDLEDLGFMRLTHEERMRIYFLLEQEAIERDLRGQGENDTTAVTRELRDRFKEAIKPNLSVR